MRKALALVGFSAVFVLLSAYTQNPNPTAPR